MTITGIDSTLAALVAVSVFSGLVLGALFSILVRRRNGNRNSAQHTAVANTLLAVSDSLNRLEGRIQQIGTSQNQTRTEIGQTVTEIAKETRESLGELRTRLKTMDRAQETITGLSNDILSLQDILSNKQTRGLFGEIQLQAIVSRALPSDAYGMQQTLSNGRRADCIVRMPDPPGDIVIDSKFPLEAYETLRNAENDDQRKSAARLMRASIRKHISDIAEKYILAGETADGAIMFLPSEAVYAELHANYSDIIREGFRKRVWIVSPTTCMATLNTLRAILKDVRLKEQASQLRGITGLLIENVDRLSDRVENLERHLGQAARDVDQIRVSTGKLKRQAGLIDEFDFDELEPPPPVDPPPGAT